MKPTFSQIYCFLSATALVALLTIRSVAAEPVQWSVASGGNDHYYQAFLVTDGITWQAASNSAAALGGYLATSTSAAENDFIYAIMSGDDRFWVVDSSGNGIGPWLGGFQPEGSPEPNGDWRWVTDETFGFTDWAWGEPNNANNENRLGFLGWHQLKDKTWNDYPDDAATTGRPRPKGYVVEWSSCNPPPPTASIRLSEVEICWYALTNVPYSVQYRSQLTTNVWVDLVTSITGSNATICVYDRLVAGQAQRFYRVQRGRVQCEE